MRPTGSHMYRVAMNIKTGKISREKRIEKKIFCMVGRALLGNMYALAKDRVLNPYPV